MYSLRESLPTIYVFKHTVTEIFKFNLILSENIQLK